MPIERRTDLLVSDSRIRALLLLIVRFEPPINLKTLAESECGSSGRTVSSIVARRRVMAQASLDHKS